MNNVLLLDADIFCFQIAARVEKEIHWGDDLWTLHSDLGEARHALDETVERLQARLGADEIILCFTDVENFRKDVFPSYKSNRKGTRKPLAYKELVKYAREAYSSYSIPRLEADDVMGILATWEAFRPGKRKIIVSADKDMQTIAGAWLFNPDKDDKPRFLQPEDADRFFYLQTLTGDQADGYPGCPGMGATTAAAFLEAPHGWETYEHVFVSGPRKGLSETRWREREVESVWEAIVDQYKKAGQNEAAALQNARCARILRASDFNHKTKEPILWTP